MILSVAQQMIAKTLIFELADQPLVSHFDEKELFPLIKKARNLKAEIMEADSDHGRSYVPGPVDPLL